MSKLFKLKKWLTVPEAASHLSSVFEEEVTEADVLRLVLDNHLKLSVKFVNGTRAKPGKIVSWRDVKFILGLPEPGLDTRGEITKENKDDFPTSLHELYENTPDEIKKKTHPLCLTIGVGNDRLVNIEYETIVTLWDVWDLPMIGGEKLDVEHEYQLLTGGPEVKIETLDGAFVEGSDGDIFQLQTSYEENEFVPGSMKNLNSLKRKIKDGSIDPKDAIILLDKIENERQIFKEKMKNRQPWEMCYPAGGLPTDSVFVVRTAALNDFIQKVNEPNASSKFNDEKRSDRIKRYVDNQFAEGKTKESAFRELAESEGCSVENIKRIYRDKDKYR